MFKLNGVHFNSLWEDNLDLTSRFRERQVQETIWECEGNMSPGHMIIILMENRSKKVVCHLLS